MRKIFVILCLILLSGCTASYNITVNDDGTTTEILTMNNIIKVETFGIELADFNRIVKEFENSGYERETIDYLNHNDKLVKQYEKFYEIRNSEILNRFSEKVELNNRRIRFTPDLEMFGDLFLLQGYEDGTGDTGLVLNINIHIPYKVMKHNADKVSGNIYTWTVDKNNFDRMIDVEYNYDEMADSSNTPSLSIVIPIIIILGIIVSIIFFIFFKNKKVNEF